jgi:hypothetical protein
MANPRKGCLVKRIFIYALICATFLALVAIGAILGSRASAEPQDPELFASCIAEATYTNPMQDKFDELVSAIKVCQR